MRNAIAVLALLLCSITSAAAQVSVGIGLPGVSIGINVPVYPQLAPIPGYPVYYAPQLNSNYFFYDGMYWVLDQDNWYESAWYNGPWQLVAAGCRAAVPVARSGALLPPSARIFSRMGVERAAALGPALGQWVGHESSRMGPLESQRRARTRATADLSAAVFRESIPARRAAANAAEPELP